MRGADFPPLLTGRFRWEPPAQATGCCGAPAAQGSRRFHAWTALHRSLQPARALQGVLSRAWSLGARDDHPGIDQLPQRDAGPWAPRPRVRFAEPPVSPETCFAQSRRF